MSAEDETAKMATEKFVEEYDNEHKIQPYSGTPKKDGVASAGDASTGFACGDHVHPTDTSRMAASATGADIPAYKGSSQSVWNAISSVGSDAAQAISKADAAVNTANGVAGALTQHADNTTIHVTAAEKATWNGKQNALTAQQLANIAAVPDKLDKSGGTASDLLIELGSYNGIDYAVKLALSSNGRRLFKLYQRNAGSSSYIAVGELMFPNLRGPLTVLASTADIRYALTTKTIDNGAVSLDDRAINAVAVSSSLASLTVNFPTATSGKARDFGLRLTVASGITTAPQIVLPQGVTCENADGEAPEIGADGAATILYFTETASGVFLVKGEVLQTITQA